MQLRRRGGEDWHRLQERGGVGVARKGRRSSGMLGERRGRGESGWHRGLTEGVWCARHHRHLRLGVARHHRVLLLRRSEGRRLLGRKGRGLLAEGGGSHLRLEELRLLSERSIAHPRRLGHQPTAVRAAEWAKGRRLGLLQERIERRLLVEILLRRGRASCGGRVRVEHRRLGLLDGLEEVGEGRRGGGGGSSGGRRGTRGRRARGSSLG